MMKIRMLAVLLATASIAGAATAKAADLGGRCCNDSEDRIAELEALAVRKGTAKESLTVSGWVIEALYFWDDGVESNVYVGTSTREQTRVRFVGEGKIDGDWSAGYTLELGTFGGDSRNFSQADSVGTRANGIATRKSSWFLKSKTFGKLTVGKEASATYHILDDGNGTNAAGFADLETNVLALGSFRVRDPSGNFTNSSAPGGLLRWIDLLNGVAHDVAGQDSLRNVIRYDSPTLAGFSIASTWGDDDIWSLALIYNGAIGDFALTGRAGYAIGTDEAIRCSPKPAAVREDCTWWGLASTIQHTPTGLFVYGVYSGQDDDTRRDAPGAATADDTDRLWLIEVGLEQKWLPLGKTTVYGLYSQVENGSVVGVTLPDSGGAFIQDSDIRFWGAGIVQNIDAAAMDLYLTYTHAGGDFNDSAGNRFQLKDYDAVISGARIKF